MMCLSQKSALAHKVQFLWTCRSKLLVRLSGVSTFQACKSIQVLEAILPRLIHILLLSISSSCLMPNPFPLKPFAIERARAVSQMAEQKSNMLVSPLLEYERLHEDLKAMYRKELDIASQAGLPTVLSNLTVRLSQWESTLPGEHRHQSTCFGLAPSHRKRC